MGILGGLRRYWSRLRTPRGHLDAFRVLQKGSGTILGISGFSRASNLVKSKSGKKCLDVFLEDFREIPVSSKRYNSASRRFQQLQCVPRYCWEV